jgi:hypothetical protein
MRETNGSRHIREIAAESMTRARHESAYPIIRVEGQFVVLYDRMPDGTEHDRYDVPVNELRSPKGVAFWVRQLAPKTWVTKRHLQLFAQTVLNINGG